MPVQFCLHVDSPVLWLYVRALQSNYHTHKYVVSAIAL